MAFGSAGTGRVAIPCACLAAPCVDVIAARTLASDRGARATFSRSRAAARWIKAADMARSAGVMAPSPFQSGASRTRRALANTSGPSRATTPWRCGGSCLGIQGRANESWSSRSDGQGRDDRNAVWGYAPMTNARRRKAGTIGGAHIPRHNGAAPCSRFRRRFVRVISFPCYSPYRCC